MDKPQTISHDAWMLLDNAGKQVKAALEMAQMTREWEAYNRAVEHAQRLAAYLGVTPDVVDFVGEMEMIRKGQQPRGLPPREPGVQPVGAPVVNHPQDEAHAFLEKVAQERDTEESS